MRGAGVARSGSDVSATYVWGDPDAVGGPAEAEPELATGLIASRYRELGEIGLGGMGQVRRVWDTRLGRLTAMKILRLEKAGQARAVERFVREARTTGRLQHPGIVPVHDMGQLHDGRWWFTMQEIQGRTFEAVLAELHQGATTAGWPHGPDAPSFRRLVDALLRVCQTMAYAHAEGFVHRDLKPENVMLGRFGEVMVLDWGLGKLVAAGGDDIDPGDELEPGVEGGTRDGGVLGSPPYMAPEQARGDLGRIAACTDVYALGAMLYHLLCGLPPHRGRSAAEIVERVKAGPPVPVVEAAQGRCPAPDEDLARICALAMARDPADRPPDAGALARELEEWLDGTRRAEEARQVVRAVAGRLDELRQWRQRARALEREAARMLARLPERPTEVELVPAWSLQDEAAGLQRRAVQAEAEAEAALQSAIALAPRATEARDLLADQYKDHLQAAERHGTPAEVTRWEALLRSQDHGRHRAWLDSGGRLYLDSEPQGARVFAYRQVERQRRLVAVSPVEVGVTPLQGVEIPRGRLVIELRVEGRRPVRFPLVVFRGDHVELLPPGEAQPVPVRVPGPEELGPDEVYVPPGWATLGGDPLAIDAMPAARVWIDGVVLGRYPVRIREYLAFLDDLVGQGRDDEAERCAPRQPPTSGGGPLWQRGPDGRFVFSSSANQNLPLDDPELPICNVTWHAAGAYAAWRAAQDGRPWRLPHDLEWEKAARGVDGRAWPWGDSPVQGRACLLDVHEGVPRLAPGGRDPAPESLYGVRDVTGNVRCYCGNAYERQPPDLDGQRLRVRPEAWSVPAPFRMVRGGTFITQLFGARLASRFAGPADQPYGAVGIRLARPFPGPTA